MLPWILCQNGTQVWRQIYEIEVHFPDDTIAVLPKNVIINIQRVLAQSIRALALEFLPYVLFESAQM